MKKIVITLIFFAQLLYGDAIKTAGDILRIALPAISFTTPLYLKDYEGEKQYIKAFILNGAITYALKFNIKKERPDGSDNFSFPSGHTSLAFNASTFIHLRYGLGYGVPAYVASAFVGYSRIESNKHYIEDVIAGALIGSLSSYLLTSPYKNISIEPIFSKNFRGLKLAISF